MTIMMETDRRFKYSRGEPVVCKPSGKKVMPLRAVAKESPMRQLPHGNFDHGYGVIYDINPILPVGENS